MKSIFILVITISDIYLSLKFLQNFSNWSFVLQTLNKLVWPSQNKSPICGTASKLISKSSATGPTFSFLLSLVILCLKAIQNSHIIMWAGYFLLFWPWGVGTMPIRGMKIHQGLFSCTEAQHSWCLHTWD